MTELKPFWLIDCVNSCVTLRKVEQCYAMLKASDKR